MTRRYIDPGFFENERLAIMAPTSRLLFSGTWCLADREGLLEDRPHKIAFRLMPCDARLFSPESAIDELVNAGFLLRHTGSDGTLILEVVNFTKYQKPHPKEAQSRLAPLLEGQEEKVAPSGVNTDAKGDTQLPLQGEKVCELQSGSSGPSEPSDQRRNVGQEPSALFDEKKQDPEAWIEVIEYLNQTTGQRFRTNPEVSHRALIDHLFKAGYTAIDIKAVIKNRIMAWGADPKMVDQLRPSTLFRKSNFENYYGSVGRTPGRPAVAPRVCRSCGEESTSITDGRCNDCYEKESC